MTEVSLIILENCGEVGFLELNHCEV